MANNTEQATFVCGDGFEHRIGQKYDERRGTGNGPQICLKCGKTLRSLVEAEATRREQAVYKRAYSAGYNAASNKEKNRYGHSHEWSISPNQDDTGTVGVRKVCNICNLETVIYDQKLHAELKRQAKGGE